MQQSRGHTDMKSVPAGSFNEALTWYVTSIGNGFDVLLLGHEHLWVGFVLRTCMADGVEGLVALQFVAWVPPYSGWPRIVARLFLGIGIGAPSLSCQQIQCEQCYKCSEKA